MTSTCVILKTVTILILSLLLFSTAGSACTGFYVGKDASFDGSTILARTNDAPITTAIGSLKIYDRIENTPGRTIEGVNGFNWALPETTFKTVGMPLSSSIGYGDSWDSFSENEYGLIVTATITGKTPKEILALDPFVKTGISEAELAHIPGLCAKTAKEAISLIAQIIDEKGSAEPNILMAADQNEAWYMEIYTGHQYAAVKMPTDKVAVFGNEFMLHTLDDYEEVIVSPKLSAFAEENAIANYSRGSLNLLETYAGGNANRNNLNHMRTWYGHVILSPSTIGDYKRTDDYPLFYPPDKKVTIKDIMNLTRSRYEGTPYENGNGKYRTIAIEKSANAHILQSFSALPANMSTLAWVTFSEPEYALYIPVSNMISDADSHFTHPVGIYGYDDDSAYCTFKRLNTVSGLNSQKFGKGVQKYWSEIEDYYLSVMPGILKNADDLYQSSPQNAQKYLTDVALSFECDAYTDAKRLIDNLLWHQSENYILLNQNNKAGTDLSDIPRNVKTFEPYFDVVKFGKILGYNAMLNRSGSAILEKGDKTIIITPSNGTYDINNLSVFPGMISVNGNVSKIQVLTDEASVYIPLSNLSILKDGADYVVPSPDKKTDSQKTAKSPIGFGVLFSALGMSFLLMRKEKK